MSKSPTRESQQGYYGKNGISLHVDVFLMKQQNLLKHVYFTVIQRCEQGRNDTLILADVVLNEFCEDFPLVSEVYIKSNNAGSYHGNYC